MDILQHPLAFIDGMKKFGVVLGGGRALFKTVRPRDGWSVRTVDLFVSPDRFDPFCAWFIHSVEGSKAERECPSGRKPPVFTGVAGICIISTPRAVFHIRCSSTSSPLAPIANSYATHLVLFISADAICIAYPTLLMNDSFVADRPAAVQQEIEKYGHRGFRSVRNVGECQPYVERGCFPWGCCAKSKRFFGDPHCLTVYFADHDGCERTCHCQRGWHEEPEAYPISAQWTFGGRGCGTASCGKRVGRQLATDITYKSAYDLY